MELMGMTIRTVVHDNSAIRCDGCLEVISGTPWRINLLDIVAPETAAPWTDHPAVNPGPFQFHSDPEHIRAWLRRRGMFVCRRSGFREIMRPVPIPVDPPRWGVCDGLHRDDHEFVPA